MRYVVMAMPQRLRNVQYLKTHIPNLEVVWDRHHDAMETFLRASEQIGQDAVVRLEDDAVLCVDFITKIENLIKSRPNEIIQTFSRSKSDVVKGSGYRGGGGWMYNLAFYVPSGMTSEIIKHYWSNEMAEWRVIHWNGLDTAIGQYLRATRQRFWLQVPSLVDHASQVSMIDSRRSRHRQSKTFENPELRNFPCRR